MSFVLISMLYTCYFIELLALTLSTPVDTMVGNHSVGTLEFWSCSALLFSGFLGLGYLPGHWTISALTLEFGLLCFSWPTSLLFPLKSPPPVFLHCMIKLVKLAPFANGKIDLCVKHLIFTSPCQIGSIDLPYTCCVCTNM